MNMDMNTNMNMDITSALPKLSEVAYAKRLILITNTLTMTLYQYLGFAFLHKNNVDKNGDDLLSFSKKLMPCIDAVNADINNLLSYNDPVLAEHLDILKTITVTTKNMFEKGLY